MPATPAWPPKSLPRLFVAAPLGKGVRVELDAGQANYLGNVLRMKAGGELLLFDGASGEWLAQIAELGKKRMTLSVERRTLLVELARTHGFLIVEDVAYRELGFAGQALPSLWSLAPDVVVQAGTTSKTLFPGVRLGWALAPPDVAARLVSAKQTTDQCAGAFGQRVFEEFQRRGWIDDQLTRSRALYFLPLRRGLQ